MINSGDYQGKLQSPPGMSPATHSEMPYGVSWKRLGGDLRREVSGDHVANGAAALAFYLMLSIFPALIALLSLLPYLPIDNLDQAVMKLISQGLPGEASQTLTGTVQEITTHRKGGLLSVGLLLTLWAASSGMYAVMQQLNITLSIKEGRPFWKKRLTAIVLTLVMGVLVIGAFGLIVVGGDLQSWLAARFGWGGGLRVFFEIARWTIVASFLLLAFSVTYTFGPNADQKFKWISPGAVFGAGILVVSSLGFKLYVDHFGKYGATYGSIGAVVVLMLWLNILGLSVLLGSELNALLEEYMESRAHRAAGGSPIAQFRNRRRRVMPDDTQNTPPKPAGSAETDASIGSVFKEVGASLKDLVASEIELIKAEMRESAVHAGKHFSQALVFGIVAAISILPFIAFAVIGLGVLLGGNYWLSSLLVGILCLAIGAPLAIRASRKLKDEDLAFEHSRHGIERGREVIEEGVQTVKDSAGRRAA